MQLRTMLGAMGLAGVLATSGCVTNSNSIYILGVAASTGGNCGFSATSLLTSTVIDSGVTGTVSVGLSVGNLIRKRNLTISNDPSTVIINEAEISVYDSSGNTLAPPYLVDVSGGVIPGSANGQTPGIGVVSVGILPPQILAGLGGGTSDTLVTVHITLRGETLGKIDVEGGVYTLVATIAPAGDLAVDCAATMASTQTCCTPGVNELYCVDATNAGKCVSQ